MFRVRLAILLQTLRTNGSRSLLAVSAVALGIASMMLMLALSAGAERQLRAINEQVGKNLFGVSAVPRLKEEDVAALREQLSDVNVIVPVREGSFTVSLGRSSMNGTVLGVTPAYLGVRNLRIEHGRFIDDRDGATRSRVAVVGSYIARKLNGGFSMAGETIRIGRVPFVVIGQLAEKGASSEGLNEDDQIVIPIETAMNRLFNTDSLSRLIVQMSNERRMDAAQATTRDVLRATHELDDDVKDDFKVLSLVRANEIRRRSSAFLEGLATLFAAVTLAIGGAGVLAVTFLNVKERIREIGLRMAIGARPKDITRMFMAEACCLSAAGGVAGLLTGWIGIALLERLLGWTMAIDLRGIVVPFAVSVFLGLAFSVLPAIQASSVMPVDALRDT